MKKSSGNSIKRSTGDAAVQVLIYLFVGGFALITLLPFLYVIAGSFELTEKAFFIIPSEISLNAYKYIVNDGSVFKGLLHSIIVTVGGTFFNMCLTLTFAYPLSRKGFKGRNLLLNMVIVTMLFSGGMIPTYLLVSGLKLLNS